jgi:branched-chain amino acid transport system substrate-binding protein
MGKRLSKMSWIVLATLLSLALVVLPACGGGGVEYTLTIGSATGGSTTPAAGTHSYDEGTVVNLVATPASGYEFVIWTGDTGTIADVNDATTTITMSADYSITPNFENAELTSLRLALGIPTGEAAGENLAIKMGVALPLSGGGEYYGGLQRRGAELAVEVIKAMGGPDLQVTYYDIEMGSAEKGVDAINQFAAKDIGMALTGWCAASASMVPGAQENKILLVDGGGGVAIKYWSGLDYFWGTIPREVGDQLDGLLEYIIREHPEWQTVATISQSYGSTIDNDFVTEMTNILAVKHLTYAGYKFVSMDTTDFSSVIPDLIALDADVLLLAPVDGPATVYFMEQWNDAGGRSQVIDSDYSRSQAQLAGEAFKDLWFCGEAFVVENAVSPFAQYFVDAYREKYGEDPERFGANYFQDTFLLWDLVRRVIAKGGDPTSGEALQNELKANPTFKSVYGGTADTVGTYTLDLTIHSITNAKLYLCGFDTTNDDALYPFARFGSLDINFNDPTPPGERTDIEILGPEEEFP